MIPALRNLLLGALLVFCTLIVSAQNKPLDYDQARAEETQRDGTVAYHGGLYNKAILLFEKALQYKPEMASARAWLAQSLYMSGLEEQALNEWKHVVQAGVKDDVLENWLEVFQARRSLEKDLRHTDRYLPLYELTGKIPDKNGKPLFMRPSAVHSLPNGNVVVAAFGSEEVLEISPNGNLVRRLPGGIGGFRAPFDALPFHGKIYVSEFTTDQISVVNSLGVKEKSFGKKGRHDGELLGPQFLATDGQSLYVSEWGNSRVSKFDPDGNFLLTFGPPAPGFDGLKNPTGLAASADRVFVSDKRQKAVFAFDTSGNWLETYGTGRLSGPEGLSLLADGRLLVSDGGKVFFLDPAQDSVTPFDPEWNQGVKVTSAILDANQNLVMADFDDNKIRVLTEGHTIYSGLVIRPIRVNTRAYPQVSVSFTVEDRWGRPITGLEPSNFVLSESRVRIVNPTLEFQGFRNTETDAALVMDRDPSMTRYADQVREVCGFFQDAHKDSGGVWVYPSGNNPLPQTQKYAALSEVVSAATDPATLTKVGKFDQAVRLAASSMIPSLKRRTVVYVTGGTLPYGAFNRYNMAELANFLRNNGIAFSVVSLNGQPLAKELEYLMKQTGGNSYSVTQDLRPYLDDVQNRVTGLYSLKYTTITPGELSTRNIPVTIEVQKFKQSSRGEVSYFAPR